MKKIISFILIALIAISCSSDDDNNKDCSLVDCFGGDIIELVFLRNNQNVLETNPSSVITMFQNNEPADFHINTISNQVTIFLIENNPIQISIDNVQLNMEFSTTFVEGECCSGNRVDDITVNNLEICANDESCDEVLEINID